MASLSKEVLVNSIQSEIERVTDDLRGVEENLKRLTGRDFTETRGERRIRISSIGGWEDEPPPKRRPPGGVFARLGEPVSEPHRGRRVHEVPEEGELPRHKPLVASSVARPVIDGKSRTEAAAELSKDKVSRERNRRMFGALLGTLQRFRTEEAKQKGKDDQRAKIEKKLEEKGRAEKEELLREKMDLISRRKERQAQIRRLNFKIERVKEHEAWEQYQRRLGNFIRTQCKPRIFWLPKVPHTHTSQLISQTKDTITRELEEERLRLKEELDEVLGGKLDAVMRAEEEEDIEEDQQQIDKGGEREGNKSVEFNNGSDLLDYDAEEGELVYDEDDLLLPGKPGGGGARKSGGTGERVVVQVESGFGVVNRPPQRRVEVVTVNAVDRSRRVREVEREAGNESEKENVSLRGRAWGSGKEVGTSGGPPPKREVMSTDKGKGRVREREKKTKEKDKLREKGEKDKGVRKSRSEKKSGQVSRPNEEPLDEVQPMKKETKRKVRHRRESECDGERESPRKVKEEKRRHSRKVVARITEEEGGTEEAEEKQSEQGPPQEEEENWEETDLSHISLPLDPAPPDPAEETRPVPPLGVTEVVVQHVPMEGTTSDEDAGSGQDATSQMRVETVLFDASAIKKDMTEWGEDPPLYANFVCRKPIVIKQEKDASPPRFPPAPQGEEVGEDLAKPLQIKSGKQDSDSTSDSEESSSSDEDEEANETSASNSSSEDSSAGSSSSDSQEEKDSKKSKKKKKKDDLKENSTPNKARKKGRAQSSSSSSSASSSSSSSDSSSSDEDGKEPVKRAPLSKKRTSGVSAGKGDPSPKPSRREADNKKNTDKSGERKREERRRESGAKSSRSRSRERRRGRRASRSKSRDKRVSRSRSRERRRDRSRSHDRRRNRR